MVVHVGNRKLGQGSVTPPQTSLVRGADVLIFNSGSTKPSYAKRDWKAWKLPLALEHRAEAAREADEELDRVEDKRCGDCQSGMVPIHVDPQMQPALANDEELVRMRGEDKDVTLFVLE